MQITSSIRTISHSLLGSQSDGDTDRVSVTIVNDKVLEFDHSFALTVEAATTTDPIGITAGSPASITFKIEDDEGNYHAILIIFDLR